MSLIRVLFLAAVIVPIALPANLVVSTYLKDGFTPSAIASDPQGNIYLAGTALTDPISRIAGAVVMKINPAATEYLYVTYLDSAATDTVSALTVDSAGNAYLTGWTQNPNFPILGSTALGAPPSNGNSQSYVTKLSPDGNVLFSVLLGGSVVSNAYGIALTSQGNILVSGTAGASGFPTTPGAYSVADSTNQWFLMELDPTADKMIFSATGIGGGSLALDSAGNIYMAGSSVGTDYPTTPGAYQTTLAQGYICYSLCQISFPGELQHVTKVDPAATKLIYSTGLNSSSQAGSTVNTGLAVDSAGNAYVTGTLFEAAYPLTVAAPSYLTGFLTKLDPTGASILFSIPEGGGGVQLDTSGTVYVGGYFSVLDVLAGPPTGGPFVAPAVFSWVPQPCLPNGTTAISAAYLLKVDPSTGNIDDGQWIDGAAPAATGLTLAGGNVWLTGFTPGADVPITPGVLTPSNLGPGYTAGGYLSAANFSAGLNTGPQIACVLDAANLTHAGAVASFQLLSIFGANLGPAAGVAPTSGTATSLGGVSVTFAAQPASLLYASASQVNVAVAAPVITTGPLPSSIVMQMTVNSASLQRQFPFTAENLNLFANLSQSAPCGGTGLGYLPLAVNADGSLNSCTNPAKFGTTMSFLVEGIGGVGPQPAVGEALPDIAAYVGLCGVAVTNTAAINNFVFEVQLTLPPANLPCANDYGPVNTTETNYNFAVFLLYGGEPVGPFVVPVPNGTPVFNFAPGEPMPMIIWVTP